MTEKAYQNDGVNFSILIIPVAVGIILVSMAWQLLLLLVALLVGWKIYDKIQWLRQCERFNAPFNQLIKQNKGCLTVLDFSYKTSLSDRAAKNFLERKAQEYGAVRKNIADQGLVYYFITASALGSIFDESDEPEKEEIVTPPTKTNQITATPSNVLTELAQLKKTQPPSEVIPTTTETIPVQETTPVQEDTLTQPSLEATPTTDTTPVQEAAPTETEENTLQLIQSELAKRLDINSSTIGKRKLEPDFAQWSQSKDPEGIAWVYVPETKVFIATSS